MCVQDTWLGGVRAYMATTATRSSVRLTKIGIRAAYSRCAIALHHASSYSTLQPTHLARDRQPHRPRARNRAPPRSPTRAGVCARCEGFTHEEIALQLGVAVGTSRERYRAPAARCDTCERWSLTCPMMTRDARAERT